MRHYEHAGIDARGTLRAVIKLGKGGGASTISQQLAKQLFHGEGSRNTIGRITQKIKEWVIATRLERQYTKEEIIAQYFNIYDFGNNADGIRSASRIYFGKEPMDLSINESAMLVGMFKNSSLYNPRPKRNPEGTKNRRNVGVAVSAPSKCRPRPTPSKPTRMGEVASQEDGIAIKINLYMKTQGIAMTMHL